MELKREKSNSIKTMRAEICPLSNPSESAGQNFERRVKLPPLAVADFGLVEQCRVDLLAPLELSPALVARRRRRRWGGVQIERKREREKGKEARVSNGKNYDLIKLYYDLINKRFLEFLLVMFPLFQF